MSEFIQIYQSTFQIKTLIQDHLDSIKTSEVVFTSLIQIFGQLVGCLPQEERSSLSRWKKGSLTKFKEYCEQFSRNASHQNKKHADLHMAAHQTWLTAIHNFELLNSLYINPYTQNREAILLVLPFKRALNTLQIRFNQVIRYLPRVMHEYWNNENVILCLLRKKTELAEIYGPDFLYKRFKWPVQTQELIQLSIQRYQSRGFESLSPIIQQIFNEEEIKR